MKKSDVLKLEYKDYKQTSFTVTVLQIIHI